MQITDVVCMITGAASGMGAATARLLSAGGAKVVICDQNLEQANRVAERINGLALLCDVTDACAVEKAFSTLVTQVGMPRICINCAGIATPGRVVPKDGPMPLADFSQVIAVNLIGTFNVLRVAASAMSTLEPVNADGERGVIINTASVAAYDGQIGQAAYSASKGGVIAMTLPIARELAQFGIRVNTIAPGLVATQMTEQMPEDLRLNLARAIPFPKRFARPEEFAALAQHIIENSYLNGETIRLDGATRLSSK